VFASLLIANRGEIACRVMRTARRMGIRTVAVYSDADRDARHVRLADEARRVGPASAAESYLNIDAILSVARESGARAIHPGYGFLSENERFAAACASAGIAFVGPSPEAIAAMGDKSAAKRLMEKAKVPLLPGYHGERQEEAFLAGEAGRIGFPVLIKPSAGGGGKGMRIVPDARSFPEALQAARREARSSFGDDRVLIERYLARPRHIEVQVFGDSHGSIVHLLERDCSVQRRHQKVLEEAPAPGMTQARRKSMCEAAVAAAKAVGYRGAGTVEFIADEDGRFYFMEMNTRLQVEHPVTEMITGLDLVEWQLRVAAGERLPLAQADIAARGHAIEARLYAEEPARDFLPSTGTLVHVAFPPESADVRVDTGVQEGDPITPWYDPMIAKLIVRGRDRAEALARLEQALGEVRIVGVASNAAFLRRIAASPAFANGELDTGLIERNRALLFPAAPPLAPAFLAAAAAAEIALEEERARAVAGGSGDPHSPWHLVDGWRLNEDSHHDFVFTEGGAEHRVRLRFVDGGLRIVIDGRECSLGVERTGHELLLRLDGHAIRASAVRDGADWHAFCDGEERRLALRRPVEDVDAESAAGTLAAPMPGRVARVLTRPGAKVSKGEPLVILEAMKMEHTIAAPADGVVKEIHYSDGEQVLEGALLISLE